MPIKTNTTLIAFVYIDFEMILTRLVINIMEGYKRNVR